jgi:sodium-dependent dicarboxylate transporter 2/3/5
LVAAVLWLVVVAYAATPISHPIAVIMLNLLEEAGYHVSFAKYMTIGLPFGFIFFVLTILALKVLVNPDFSKFEAYDPEKRRKELKPLTMEAKVAIAVFIFIVITWLLPDALSFLVPTISAYFKSIGIVAAPIVGIAIMCIIRVKNEDGTTRPMLDLKKAIYKVSIPTLIFIVGIQSFANTLNHKDTGVSTFLGNLFMPLANAISPTALVLVSILLAVVLTQFLSNLVVQSLFWSAFYPVLLQVSQSGGNMNVAAFGILLSIACNLSFLFPSSYVCAPLCYSSGYLEIKDGLKYGTPVVLISYLILMLIFFPLASSIL